MFGALFHRLLAAAALTLFAGSAIAESARSANSNPINLISSHTEQVSDISLNTLRAIFTMRLRSWPDGKPIQVFVLPEQHPLHTRFCKQVLRVYPYILSDNWKRLVFTGTGTSPVVVATEEELIEKVNNTPGSIGYVGSAQPGAEMSVLVHGPSAEILVAVVAGIERPQLY